MTWGEFAVGVTVAKAICTPLRKQDSIVLYDAATGQRLQSTCRELIHYSITYSSEFSACSKL